jgi:uncharacterized protein with HEPN domain
MSKADKLRIPDYLGHILEAIQRIHLYVEDMDEVKFLEDPKTQDAVIRNFEIIGEACRNIELHHPGFAATYPEMPWGFAYEMRNALAHGFSRWIWKSSGRRFIMICPGWLNRFVTSWER